MRWWWLIDNRIPEDAIHILVSLIEGDSNVNENTWRCYTHSRFSWSKVIRMTIRIPEDVKHILVSLGPRLLECQWEYLTMSYTSSFLLVEGYSNVDENTWRCHTHPRFSWSIVIRMSMRIPEDVIHILIAIFSFLLVEGHLNVDENTWRCHTHSRFSWSKVIRMSMRIPEDVIHILVSLG